MKNNKIPILIFGMTSMPGGIESFVLNYLRHFERGKFQFDILCYNEQPAYFRELTEIGCRVFIIPGRKKYFSCRIKTKKMLRENDYTIIWTNICSLSDVLILKLAIGYKIKRRIVHAHNANNNLNIINNILHKYNKRRIDKYATDFWACSHEAAKFFYPQHILESKKVKIIHNAIDVKKYKFDVASREEKREELNIANRFVVGHIGRFCYQKNHEYLVRIFHEIHKLDESSILLLIGDGELFESVKRKVRLLGLSDCVLFLGLREDIPALLHAMDVFILPSRFEGLPIVLLEAQAASLYSFVSTEITNEGSITNMVSFVDLYFSPRQWAELINKKKNYIRHETYRQIQEKNYDIETEALVLEEYLSE
jgi:glycosyltransferase involved in cell wall biosynthesis